MVARRRTGGTSGIAAARRDREKPGFQTPRHQARRLPGVLRNLWQLYVHVQLQLQLQLQLHLHLRLHLHLHLHLCGIS